MIQCGAVTSLPILSYVTASISAVLCLITVPGNLLICLAVYIDPYHRLRTPFNIVVANLAFADLIVGCITEPLSVYLHIKEGIGREITKAEIRSIHLSYFISCTASVLSISLLALERYISISYSFKYRLYFKARRFVLVSIIVWLVAIGLSTVYVITSYVFYAFVFITIAVLWTLGMTTFCYVKILRKLKKTQKQVVESTVIDNTNAILGNVCPLTKAHVVKVAEKFSERGVNNNESSVEDSGNQNEECSEPHGVESCSSEFGHSHRSRHEVKASEIKTLDDTPNSSKENNKGVNNVGYDVSIADSNSTDENVNSKDSSNSIEEGDQNRTSLQDCQCSHETRKECNDDKEADMRLQRLESKHGTAREVCENSAASYKEYTSNKYNILVTKTYIMVSVIFLACYIPALMIIYTMNWCQTCNCTAMHIMRDLQFIIVMINSLINPFLYAIRFAHFRRAISKILQDIRDEVFY